MLALEVATPKSVDHHEVQLRRADRFDQVGVSAVLDRGLAQLGIVDPRHHDHCCARTSRFQLLEQSVARFVRQPDVEDGQRVVLGLELFPRLGRSQCGVSLKAAAAQSARHNLGQGFLVVDDENPFGASRNCHGHAV